MAVISVLIIDYDPFVGAEVGGGERAYEKPVFYAMYYQVLNYTVYTIELFHKANKQTILNVYRAIITQIYCQPHLRTVRLGFVSLSLSLAFCIICKLCCYCC